MILRLFVFVPLLLTGCALFTRSALPQRRVLQSEADGDKIQAFSTPADLRLGFVRPKDSAATYCAEPLPDVALGSEASASGSLAAAAAVSNAASLNASLTQENQNLKNELAKAVDTYERETNRQYKTSATRTLSQSSNSSTSGSLNLEAAARLAVSVSELGGRSQQVLLAREFLYRICEARANNFTTKSEDYSALQTSALQMIQNIYTSQQASSVAQNLQAQTELIKQTNEYNIKQLELCTRIKTNCDLIAAANANEKLACAKRDTECVVAIKYLPVPSEKTSGQEGKPKSLLEDLRGSRVEAQENPAAVKPAVEADKPAAPKPAVDANKPAAPKPTAQ